MGASDDPLLAWPQDRLEFAVAARESFSFLLEMGFQEIATSGSQVQYIRGDVLIHAYLDAQDWDIQFDINWKGRSFPIVWVLRFENPEAGERFVHYVVKSPTETAEGLGLLARLVQRHAQAALAGDRQYLSDLNAKILRQVDEKYGPGSTI